ncbi:pyridoxal phosphate-dependent transferase [Phascolomyces articulosus]|uniref:Glutamate pyruvate transaminase n=1 Tax=Phascolomyces articulosus TaxID=60185 RepID=A0AAD5PHX6_9FUNG|nr:pyridoxal phosphate-dependent transferase [Phascolomyces articulosus]
MLRNLYRTTSLAARQSNIHYRTLRLASTGSKGKVLTTDRINPHIRNAEYAVRGALPIRAEALSKELQTNKSLGFDRVVFCNIGNPQQLQQKPITFFRQVASLCDNPELLKAENREDLLKLYPQDAIDRAELLLKHIGSVGAYSHSQGLPHIRENIAKFLERRDGFPANPEHIYLTQGASSGVQNVLQMLTENEKSGIMIPIPQYPLYSATLSLINATPVPYYLKEEQDWGLSVAELKKSVDESRAKGVDVRALAIINPGNPTGQCLTEGNMREIVDFCKAENLVLLADEVYQTNIYKPEQRPFHSFKKVLRSMGEEYNDVELFSFHSTSKGMIGECGRRGGYLECVNIDEGVLQQLYKVASISLCPNVHGQIMTDLMTNPPVEGDASYELYNKEVNGIYESLRRRATKLASCFNGLENVTCNDAEGAMYLFPRVRIPNKAIEAAKEAGVAADAFYALKMLEATGVCVIPGSGFGQEPNTWHFRSTFLPEEHLFDQFCSNIEKFHKEFMNEYRD